MLLLSVFSWRYCSHFQNFVFLVILLAYFQASHFYFFMHFLILLVAAIPYKFLCYDSLYVVCQCVQCVVYGAI